MNLPSFTPKVVKMLSTAKYKYITPAIVIAVCLQESGGDPCFEPQDALLGENLRAASVTTTLPIAMIVDAMKIQAGIYKGKIAKFRLEPSYWIWTGKQKLSSPTERLLCACSFGVGQKMMRWIVIGNPDDWIGQIEQFKSSLDTQLAYLIHDMDRLLSSTQGDLLQAYKGYNSGYVNSVDPAVVARAQNVVALAKEVETQLR